VHPWTLLRKSLRTGLPLVGILVVFSAVLWIDTLNRQLLMVAVGIFLIEVGAWRLTDPILPSDRRNDSLRAEVNLFIRLVRQLHDAALQARGSGSAEAVAVINDARSDLMRSADQIAQMATNPEALNRRPAHR
jgi:hypothetical protein